MSSTNEWRTLVPTNDLVIVGNVPIPFAFDDDITISELPKMTKTEELKSILSEDENRFLENSKFSFTARYEAEGLGSDAPEAFNKTTKQLWAVERIHIAYASLWIAKPNRIYTKFIMHFEKRKNKWTWRRVADCRTFHQSRLLQDAPLTEDDLEQAVAIYKNTLETGGKGGLWVATTSLRIALMTSIWEPRFLLLWTALEALFGPENPGEITFKISMRISFFLENAGESRRKLRNSVKKLYSYRSKLIHGREIKKLEGDESAKRILELETLLAKSLGKILADDKLAKTFNGRKREEYLDNLFFSMIP